MANDIFRLNDYVGLYFSASWCPPCQTFLPLLKQVHSEARSRNIKFEIIFVSADTDHSAMMDYFEKYHGSW